MQTLKVFLVCVTFTIKLQVHNLRQSHENQNEVYWTIFTMTAILCSLPGLILLTKPPGI